MEITCLSEGKGYHFPACHILDISGFRVLCDCPLDLSALSIFSPIPSDRYHNINNSDGLSVQDNEQSTMALPVDAKSLIRAEPYYKTVPSLHLWNVSFIDIVLISSPIGMLGLPYLTRNKDFSAKIYATEATARVAQLMMEELVSMHMEFKKVYGPQDSCLPQWLKWEVLDALPVELKDIVLGKDGMDLGGWMQLYSAGDVKNCFQKVQTLKFAEEVCYNGLIMINAFSSGLDIGFCNWTITGSEGRVAYMSASVFASATAMDFDHRALEGSDLVLYTDSGACGAVDNFLDESDNSTLPANFSNLSENVCTDSGMKCDPIATNDEKVEEMEKLAFICTCSSEAVRAGGSVLIPIGRLGIVLQLLEQIALFLESSNLEVPIFIVSSAAEELLAFVNVIPEWLCQQRQDQLYSGRPLFRHVDLINKKRLHLFPAIHSVNFLTMWQEPCILFCPHWNLRLGPVAHLLHRWRGDPNSLLVIEDGVDSSLALLPFKPMAMKVLQCSFLSGIKFQRIRRMLAALHPNYVMLPEILKRSTDDLSKSFSVVYYSESETVQIPNLKGESEIDIAMDLASVLQCKMLGAEDTSTARLNGELYVEQGKHRLHLTHENLVCAEARPLLLYGRLDPNSLLMVLEKMGVKASVQRHDNAVSSQFLHVLEPSKAVIEVTATHTVVSCSDENLASMISESICGILTAI